MRKKIITSLTFMVFATGIIFSCKKKNDSVIEEAPTTTTTSGTTTGGTTGNTGSLNIYLIDTAKINTITESGTNETTIINKLVNSNSYMPKLSLSADGNKFAYGYLQTFKQVRVADKTGANDLLLYSTTANTTQIGAIKYGTNNKVYFTLANYGGSPTYSFCAVNSDATGFTSTQTYYDVIDISSDGNYFISRMNSTTAPIQITDRNLDGGAGGTYYNDVFTYPVTSYPRGVFTNDNKKAVLAFIDGTAIKIREIDMQTKTATTKTIVSAFNGSPSSFVHVAMASDNNRGIITVSGYGNTTSTSYIINLSTSSVTAQFTNNDIFVGHVYPY